MTSNYLNFALLTIISTHPLRRGGNECVVREGGGWSAVHPVPIRPEHANHHYMAHHAPQSKHH